MSPDIVLGWLKCAGYGLGLIVCVWVFLQKVQEREVIEIETAKDCRTCIHCADIDSLGHIHCTCPRFHSPGRGVLLNVVIMNERTKRIIVPLLLSRRLVLLQTEQCHKLLKLMGVDLYDKKTICKIDDGQWLG